MNTLQKELPKRFTDAIGKLYDAFHKGDLNALSCTKCAIGNLCDNKTYWARYANDFDYKKTEIKTGYSINEIEIIENIFVSGYVNGERKFTRGFGDGTNIETNFLGLCEIVKYLCELDGIPNIMDYTSLFEFDEKKQPIKELNF